MSDASTNDLAAAVDGLAAATDDLSIELIGPSRLSEVREWLILVMLVIIAITLAIGNDNPADSDSTPAESAAIMGIY